MLKKRTLLRNLLSNIVIEPGTYFLYRSVIDLGSALSPASQNSLVKQVVSAIFDSQKEDLVDIKMISSGVKDMLKSGFG